MDGSVWRILASDEPETARLQNHLERLRDPSHTQMLSASALLELAHTAGLKGTLIEIRDVERPLQPWLTQSQTGAAATTEIITTLESELDGGAPSGFRPRREDDELMFSHSLASVIAVKP